MKEFQSSVKILDFEPKLAIFFKTINAEWLNHYYSVTKQDLDILDHPENIINAGGAVIFTEVNSEIVGTGALIRVNDETVELIKMGVKLNMHGRGVGNALMEGLIQKAVEMNAKKILLETASPLKAAISLYQKHGFIQTSDEEIHPVFGRKTFKMEKSL